MPLIIASNANAIHSQNQIRQAQNDIDRSLQRIASGKRINSAKDDVAGLQIATRMESQIRGLGVAKRNASDGISLVQTMDGALNEISNLLQRARELGIQATNQAINNAYDRESIQEEYDQILNQIDQINTQTVFNRKQAFSQGKYAAAAEDPLKRDVVTGLKSYWLKEAENRVKTFFGIDGSDKTLGVDFDFTDGAGSVLARVVYSGTERTLQMDLSDFIPSNLPNGGSSPFYADRVIAHEMVHAVFAASVNVASMPDWFNEGMAEFIHGADERVVGDGGVAVVSGGTLLASFAAATSADYSRSYIAVRYLHEQLKNLGTEGVKDITEYMAQDQTRTFDQAVAYVSKGTYANAAAFQADYEANKVAFAATLDLANNDTGAIGGLDADGGTELRAEDIFPNQSSLGEDPLSSFLEKIDLSFDPTAKQGGRLIRINIDQKGNSLDFRMGSFNHYALGLKNTNMTTDPNKTISYIDDALTYINGFRSNIGAVQNRLESTIRSLDQQQIAQSASQAQIQDTDLANESTALARTQIIQQAGVSVLAQSNNIQSLALKLLA